MAKSGKRAENSITKGQLKMEKLVKTAKKTKGNLHV